MAIEYFTTADDGQHLRLTDADDHSFSLGAVGQLAEVYTTYSPLNAERILDYTREGREVAVCSDFLVDCTSRSGDPGLMADSLRAARFRCVEHGGFRRLTSLDLLHYTLHADWNRPGFRFDDKYLAGVDGPWSRTYPLNPYFNFLGLDPVWCVFTLASWVDYRRFTVSSSQEHVTDRLFSEYMGLDALTPQEYEWILKAGACGVLCNDASRGRLRRWVMGAATWSSRNVFKHPHMAAIYRRKLWQHRDEDRDEQQYRVTCEMTELAINYLYVHQRWLYSGGIWHFNPFTFFGASPDVAAAYQQTFGNAVSQQL
jgi:hypothetical protein